MRYLHLVVATAVLAVIVPACATVAPRTEPPDSEIEFRRALVALRTGDYRAARHGLLRVANGHSDEALGRRALLALAAAELDPRNPDRSSDVAGTFAARFLSTRDTVAWTLPLAETVYLLSLDLGARASDSLPRLPDQPLVVRMRMLQAQRDSLAAERDALEAARDSLARHAAALELRLAERERELERIRRTLRH